MTPQEKQQVERNIRDMMERAARKPEHIGIAGLGAAWLAAEMWAKQAMSVTLADGVIQEEEETE